MFEPSGKSWPQGFYKRHPELKVRKVIALGWTRHDHKIYDRLIDWFSTIMLALHRTYRLRNIRAKLQSSSDVGDAYRALAAVFQQRASLSEAKHYGGQDSKKL
jgi:hypothetical protein